MSPFMPNDQDLPANPTPVKKCLNDNDIIVLLDSSGSIGPANYRKEKEFAYDLARVFEDHVGSRFGFTIFSSEVLTIAPLTNTLTPADLNYKILNAVYMGNGTLTNLAIDSAVAEFQASARTVPKNLVIITDGDSNKQPATINSINTAINYGIRTFSVGIGSGTSNKELLAIAGGKRDHTFTAKNFDQLAALVNPVREIICQ